MKYDRDDAGGPHDGSNAAANHVGPPLPVAQRPEQRPEQRPHRRSKASSQASRRLLWSGVLLACLAGCQAVAPKPPLAVALQDVLVATNERDWKPTLAKLSTAEFRGPQVTVRNIRYCRYLTEDDYVLDYYDRTFRLDEIRTVDFIMVPFQDAPSLAHTMLSFGLADGDYIVVSVEVRLETDEVYSPVKGLLRQYELMYVVGDERDLILLRTEHRQAEVYLYPTRATPDQARDLFVDMMNRANQLAVTPEFYDTLSNNCTTNIVRHINRLRPGKISPLDPRIVLPGYSDQLASELGLLAGDASQPDVRRRALVNELAHANRDRRDFSRRIRANWQTPAE